MRTLLTLIAFGFLFSACSKNKDGADQSQMPYYFTATINGKKVSYQANNINTEYASGTNTPAPSQGYDRDQYCLTTIESSNYFIYKEHIEVGTLQFFTDFPTIDQRIAMIHKGSFNFGLSKTSRETINGGVVRFYDAQEKEWSSELGSQSGSSFNITEVVDLPDNGGFNSARIVTIKFSCKVYDETGNSLEVKDATIRGVIIM